MAHPLSDHDMIADILAFHLEAGVDVALGEEPMDRFAETAAEKAAPRPRAQLPQAAEIKSPSSRPAAPPARVELPAPGLATPD
ncbi:MAG TPA: uracil-DNA glycosylase, partial [Ancylobacter sp.]